MLGIVGVRAAAGTAGARSGGNVGCLLIACPGILPIAVLFAGKPSGIPPAACATELAAKPIEAIKHIDIIFFIIVTFVIQCGS